MDIVVNLSHMVIRDQWNESFLLCFAITTATEMICHCDPPPGAVVTLVTVEQLWLLDFLLASIFFDVTIHIILVLCFKVTFSTSITRWLLLPKSIFVSTSLNSKYANPRNIYSWTFMLILNVCSKISCIFETQWTVFTFQVN